MSFHIRSQLLQMHRCYSKCVCFSLKCTAALDQVDGQVVRDYLIIFRILDSESSLKIICLEYGLGYAILSASILFCASYLVNPGLYTFREGEMGGDEHSNTANKVNEHRITVRKVDETPLTSHTVRFEITATPQIEILFTASPHKIK